LSACAVCQSPARAEIESLISEGLAHRVIIERAAEAGYTVYPRSLTAHKKHMLQAVEAEGIAAEIDRTWEALRQEMERSPNLLKPLYLTILQNLSGLKNGAGSVDQLIRAVGELQRLTGRRDAPEFLAAFGRQMFERFD
jgi:hypothetical protein